MKLFLNGLIKYLCGLLLVGMLIFLTYPIVIIARIKNEEKVLVKELPGYREYRKKVKYRLIPFIW